MGDKDNRIQEINYEGINLFFSITMNIVAIGLLIVTILTIPLPYSNGWIIGQDNFFYKSIGAFIGIVWYIPQMFIRSFIVIITVSIALFSSTFLLKDFENTKKVIVISMISSILPIIAAIISAVRLGTIERLNIFSGWFNTWYLGFFPFLMNLPLYLTLLLRKESLKSWAGFSNRSETIHPTYLKQRKIASIFFLLVYISNYSVIIIYIIYHYIIWKRSWIVLLPIILYLVWWILGELIVKRWMHRKTAKKLILDDVNKGITDIDFLAKKHLLSKEKVNDIIYKIEKI